jgi:hypothetical protein
MDEQEIKMVLPCNCPHCGEPLVMKFDFPIPEVEVTAAEKHDTSKEPETT